MADQANKDKKEKGILQAGQKAPDFSLHTTPDQSVSLNSFKGRPVVLVFYPGDWSPVCGSQLALYNEILSEFQKYDAEVLGISVDSTWSHLAYQKDKNLRFPLLSDFNPKGEVGKMYGAYNEEKGKEKRALFVIDEKGMIRWSYLSPAGVNPGAEGILSALEEMKNQPEKEETHG